MQHQHRCKYLFFAQNNATYRHEADPQRDGNEVAATPRHMGSIPGFGLSPLASFPRSLGDGRTAAVPPDLPDSETPGSPAKGVGPAGGAASAVELDASMTGEAEDNTAAAAATPGEVNGKENEEEEARGGAGTGGATALTREFPAMVLPKEAVVLAGQKSGSLPSQWYNIREEYGQGCLFLLTLQVKSVGSLVGELYCTAFFSFCGE